MKYDKILKKLKSMSNPDSINGMARFGINPNNNFGISVTTIRNIAKEIGKDHNLALRLWDSGIRDARMLAVLIDNPRQVTEKQMDNRFGNSKDVRQTNYLRDLNLNEKQRKAAINQITQG